VGCNGLVYVKNNQAFMVDTPNDNEASEELINWLENNLKVKGVGVVGTHFHSDCLGGLETFKAHGIHSYTTSLTQKLAVRDSMSVADEIFDQ